jgi:hypothetical protein
MNALATINAVRRNQPEVADGLLQRGYERVRMNRDARQTWPDQIRTLATSVALLDSQISPRRSSWSQTKNSGRQFRLGSSPISGRSSSRASLSTDASLAGVKTASSAPSCGCAT